MNARPQLLRYEGFQDFPHATLHIMIPDIRLGDNRSIGRVSFDEKKDQYAKSVVKLTNEIRRLYRGTVPWWTNVKPQLQDSRCCMELLMRGILLKFGRQVR